MAEWLRSALLAGVPHGFSTRAGPSADSLVAGAAVVRARQVHSPDAVIVAEPPAEPPVCDALVTDRAGLVLGIVTADCAPVLLADSEAGVVGAAHAGWRGAQGGVLENTLAAMMTLGAEPARVRAVIGPAIAQPSYEVDERFRENFGAGDARFFAAGRPGHWQFDLPGYVAARLHAAGVGTVENLALDTYVDPGRFYSFRRATHRGEPTEGRQTSVIALA